MVDASARRKAVVALVQRTNLVIHTVGERTFQHMDRFVDIRMPMGGRYFRLGLHDHLRHRHVPAGVVAIHEELH